MNKQVLANNIMQANHARNQAQASVIIAVCIFATLVVGVTSFSV